eukprot:TRINITY_DN16329_c0_g1_i1.p1 TRINITY_DN16329_c0_g1~~TRINITY_DN16329_c0_g1_i1.p1  ORF type:complete len:171 (-),score=4.08 TRINITY_DN16329_c0_g1_i1:389-877(-)
MALSRFSVLQLLRQTAYGRAGLLANLVNKAGAHEQHVSSVFEEIQCGASEPWGRNVTRSFHAGTNVMHAAKVKGQRDAEDFIEEYPGIAEGPPRGRFVPKSEEEVFEDHRRSSILRCMGASYGQGEVLSYEARQVSRKFITPSVILEGQNKLAHHHHHEVDH